MELVLHTALIQLKQRELLQDMHVVVLQWDYNISYKYTTIHTIVVNARTRIHLSFMDN